MSLLDRGSETVVFYPAGATGADGSPAAGSVPVTVRCMVQPAASGESVLDNQDGFTVTSQYRVMARSIPAGPWARAVWRGRDWTVVGEVARNQTSPRTTHDVVTIRRR